MPNEFMIAGMRDRASGYFHAEKITCSGRKGALHKYTRLENYHCCTLTYTLRVRALRELSLLGRETPSAPLFNMPDSEVISIHDDVQREHHN